jgi:hypothetical protein
LVQELEQSWSNTNINNQTELDKPVNDSKKNSATGLILNRKSKSSVSSVYNKQRTKSLCVGYNTNIFSYARAIAAKETKKISMSGSNQNANKSMKILQNHEKILEIQNKWTGNGKFIIKAKSSFLVSFYFILINNRHSNDHTSALF